VEIRTHVESYGQVQLSVDAWVLFLLLLGEIFKLLKVDLLDFVYLSVHELNAILVPFLRVSAVLLLLEVADWLVKIK